MYADIGTDVAYLVIKFNNDKKNNELLLFNLILVFALLYARYS